MPAQALVLLLSLFLLLPYPTAHAADEGRINISIGDNTYKIPYFRNYALSTRNDNIRRVVIAIHGAGDENNKAEVQYERMTASACLVLDSSTVPATWVDPPAGAACPRLDTTLVMAPHFMQAENLSYYSLTSDGLYWDSNGWKFGNKSLDAGSYPRDDRVSSYEVMDMIIEFLATSGNFPNLGDIVIAGHSAGGQYVNRYAAISPIETTIAGSGVEITYVVANPSSYLYFTDERVYPGTLDTFIEPHPFFADLCPDPDCCPEDIPCPLTYDDYIYGLGNPDSYNGYLQGVADAIGVEGIKSRYRNRSVVYLLGREDNDPCADALDITCGALLEGRYRLERGLIYFNYIGHALGDSVYDNHYLETIANAGHSSNRAWRSNVGRKHIFDTAAIGEFPEIFAPRGTVDFPDHTYKWYAVPGTSNYRISVTDTSGGGGSFTETVSAEDAGCARGGLCVKRITRAVNAGTWTVSAQFLTTWFDSAPATFQVGPPGATSVHKPSGTTVDHTPTFRWNAADGAARYQFAVFSPSGINYIRSYSELDAQCDCGDSTHTCVVTPDLMLNDGNYWWMVRPANAEGMGPWTAPEAFTVQTPALLAGGDYALKVRSSGRCLEYDRGRDENVHVRTCRGSSAQRWSLSGSMSVADLELANSSPAICLEADDAGGADFTNGGNVQGDRCVNTSSGDDHQEWSIDWARDGYYTLEVRSSGKCLDADNYANRDMRDCGNVQVWDCKDPGTRNTDNQEWGLEPIDADEFRRPEKPATYPQPYITVNGEHRTVTLRRGDTATIGFSLVNWNTIGPECDWWVVQTSPSGMFFLTPSGWTTDARPILQAPILDFPPPVVELPVPTAGLPLGTYWLYFAVDMVPDGFVSLNHLYLAGIRVDLVP